MTRYFEITTSCITFIIMDFIYPNDRAPQIPPAKGKLLIAAPFLSDPDFSRSVVFLCEHGEEGTMGFILNQPSALTLGDLLTDQLLFMPPLAIYQGGPVQPDTLHILHRMPEVLGGMPVAPGVYWGGSYETLKEIAREGNYKEQDLRLFMGYSGWSEGQLDREMTENSWLVGAATEQLLFETEPHLVWKQAISSLGSNYSFLANMPIDPQLN